MAQPDSPISLHPENPRYFLYRGKPRVLVTATEHYGSVLNRNFDYVRYLDEAADKNMTLSRCFLLFRELEASVNPHSPCKPIPGEFVSPSRGRAPATLSMGIPSSTSLSGIQSTSSACTGSSLRQVDTM